MWLPGRSAPRPVVLLYGGGRVPVGLADFKTALRLLILPNQTAPIPILESHAELLVKTPEAHFGELNGAA